MPTNGVGNITNQPLFVNLAADNLHLQSNSACIDTGNNAYVDGTADLDGNPRISGGAVDMGAYEFQPISASVQANFTYVAPGFPVNFSATIYGQTYGPATSNAWNFGDGTVTANVLKVTHDWTTPGSYPVSFTAFSTSNPSGVPTTVLITVTTQSIYYVNASNPYPVSPYYAWNIAANNVQDAVNVAAASTNGVTIMVADGIYPYGGMSLGERPATGWHHGLCFTFRA